MHTLKLTVPAAALAALLSLALAACGDSGPEQQSSATTSEQPSDAAATMESTTETETDQSQ